MTRPYSEDLRERAVARYEAGETTRSIAAALRISPSCVSKWMKLKRETGSLAPGKVGGHKKRTLSGEPAAWLRERCRSGAVHHPGLDGGASGARHQERPARRLGVAARRGAELQKNRAAGRADAARHRPQAGAMEEPSGPD